MTEATQNLIDEARAVAYVLGVMAESAESLSTDEGEAEALNGMMLRLFDAARDSEQAEDAADKVDAGKVISRLEAIEDQLGDAITDGDAWGGVDEDHPFYRVISAKNGILDLIRYIEAANATSD